MVVRNRSAIRLAPHPLDCPIRGPLVQKSTTPQFGLHASWY